PPFDNALLTPSCTYFVTTYISANLYVNATAMSSYSPAPELPGEHGIHRRDGSLMRKKREQWGKEKGGSYS
ncbi:hypothetical protein AAVH_09770, partial [Aphelenchoides avenae]